MTAEPLADAEGIASTCYRAHRIAPDATDKARSVEDAQRTLLAKAAARKPKLVGEGWGK